MPLEITDHKGKKIIFVDYKGLNTTVERIGLLEKYAEEAKKLPDQSVLALWDVTNQFASPGFMKRVKELKKEVFDAKVVSSAIIGVTGVKRILFDGYNKIAGGRIRALATKEKAMEYLKSKA